MATVCFTPACGEGKFRIWPSHAIRAWPGSLLTLVSFNSFSVATGHAMIAKRKKGLQMHFKRSDER